MSKETDPIKFWKDRLQKRWLVTTIQMGDVEEAINNLISFYEQKIKFLEIQLEKLKEVSKEQPKEQS
jgi:hypothetical protein